MLRTYTALHFLRSDWAGNLILSLGLSPRGAALSVAANIAGAVTLAIDPDPVHLREVVRTGACDFIVNSLDEAVRAMKNEVRKCAPLSVALNAELAPALAEIEERGLSPQLFSNFVPHNQEIDHAISHLRSLGAMMVDFDEGRVPPNNFTSSDSIVAPLLRRERWHLYEFAFDTLPGLRAFDAKLLSTPEADGLRRRWIEAAPRVLPRQHPPTRSLWLTREEASTLRAEFSSVISSNQIS